jgi:hypothetical protein
MLWNAPLNCSELLISTATWVINALSIRAIATTKLCQWRVLKSKIAILWSEEINALKCSCELLRIGPLNCYLANLCTVDTRNCYDENLSMKGPEVNNWYPLKWISILLMLYFKGCVNEVRRILLLFNFWGMHKWGSSHFIINILFEGVNKGGLLNFFRGQNKSTQK